MTAVGVLELHVKTTSVSTKVSRAVYLFVSPTQISKNHLHIHYAELFFFIPEVVLSMWQVIRIIIIIINACAYPNGLTSNCIDMKII